MSVGDIERKTQNRVVRQILAEKAPAGLGYSYAGNWQYEEGHSNIEAATLLTWLDDRGVKPGLGTKAVEKLQKAATIGGGVDLYEANREVFKLLRYGVKVSPGHGQYQETVWLIDWEHPEANIFEVAEEVTIVGAHNKRPDVVLYVNGIALAVLELKRSTVSVSEGIRQTIGNQREDFIRPFFATVQLVLAGNDTEGLRYGVIQTPEKYWLSWREDPMTGNPLDRALRQICSKERLLELIHDFMVFDSGTRKVARHNQYFGVKAAQERVARREGGIIWHTQGSGKSLTMVWLAGWLREHQPDARVLILTDREELDEQIEGKFNGVGQTIYRTSSGADLLATLNSNQEWLICSLIHKFGLQRSSGDDDDERDQSSEAYIRELRASLPAGFSAKGNLFVFIDEAHRTQSGKLHDAVKEIVPGAMFIGFTGTPLLARDKTTSIEKFGTFIHTYKYNEAVRDGVVLDLRYEARDIDQSLSDRARVDLWFEAKTQGMTDLARAELKQRWVTMQRIFSSKQRIEKIVTDVLLDMDTRPRLASGRGTALLVSSSIYQACKFYEAFAQTALKGKCAVITSYQPNAGDISKEDAGVGLTELMLQYDIYRQMIADHFGCTKDEATGRVEQFEKDVKALFQDEPAQMRLLIVVDKLLTGFDAPSATYLYIDKPMQDHGLFQAICRVNRLDGDDKDYGYIVDYRGLFKPLEQAIETYTGDAFDGFDKEDVNGLLTDRVKKADDDMQAALEAIRALCEPVPPPKGTQQYLEYFCAVEHGNAEQLKANEPRRVELYKAVSDLARAYANLAPYLNEAGYTADQAKALQAEVRDFVAVRGEVQLAAGEKIDFKQYEPDMRQLLDRFIDASASRTIADFEDTTLLELIAEKGEAAIDLLPEGIRQSKDAVAETIANNVRAVITVEQPLNPAYYDKMSRLLDELLDARRKGVLDYETYLKRLIEYAKQVHTGESGTRYPAWARGRGQRALIDLFWPNDRVVVEIDEAVLRDKPDSWVGDPMKERVVKRTVARVIGPDDSDLLERVVALLREHREYQ